jgi:peptidoglycan/xylan/chitin deacetylase (PgdA/CDA1 family)
MIDRRRLPVVLLVLLSIVAAACLPNAVGPSGSPGSRTPAPPAGPPSPSGPTREPSFVPPTPTPMPTFRTYVVVRNDNLTSIARTFETTARSIAYWNRGTYPSLDPESETYSPNRIEIGWSLVLIPGVVVDPQTLPDQTPLPASPRPGQTAAPGQPAPVTPAPGAGAIVTSHGSRDRRQVALTFDMGGRLDPALDIMGWLAEHDVHATIFPTGKAGTETVIGRQAVQLAAGRPDLFELANHSWDHPTFTELDAAAIADQLNRTESGMGALAGATTKPWFRPPFGAWDEDVRKAVGGAGWAYLVMWDVDTIDWRPTVEGGPTARDIEAKVLSRVEGGSIVLMHLGGWNTLEALPAIIDGLRAKGLEPVTLSELLLQ